MKEEEICKQQLLAARIKEEGVHRRHGLADQQQAETQQNTSQKETLERGEMNEVKEQTKADKEVKTQP